MPSLTMAKYGLFAVHDSGAPAGSNDYTTLVILHGFAWHAGIFSRFLPLAQKCNARIVLVNRRDYPGSAPFDEGDLRQVSSITTATPEAIATLKDYMKQRARELYDFLGAFVEAEKIPKDGGLIVAGWSFGANWITALLANVSTFPVGKISLAPYVRRLVLYDPPYHALGYPPPAKFYNPLTDPSHAPGEGVKLFPSWVSGYYLHGDSPSELEHRTALPDPRPTIETMAPEDIESALYPLPGNPGGSDAILMEAGIQHGLYAALRKATLYPPSPTNESMNDWSAVELRYVWCDHSVWEMPWGTWALQAELEDAKRSGKQVRKVQLVRLEGANHFAHWDMPDRALQALLADDARGTVASDPSRSKSAF